MKRSVIDLWVGLFIVIGIASIAFLAFKAANLTSHNNHNSYTLYAEFNNIGNLTIKAPVKSAGVIIGRVTDIQLDAKKYVAHITLTIDKRYRFSQDVSAEILTAGLLGEQYINLTQGIEPQFIEPNQQISITSSALVLEQLIGQFMSDLSTQPSTDK